MVRSRSCLVFASASFAAALWAAAPNPAPKAQGLDSPRAPPPPADSTVLTLIGTQGGPSVSKTRAGESSLLTVRGKRYLIDAGIGASRRLAEAGVPLSSLTKIFITHLHNDHTADLPGLMALYSGAQGPLEIMGPPRTAAFVGDVLTLLAFNAEIRAEQGGAPLAQTAALFKARDVQPGLVYSDDAVQVTALENGHFHFAAGSPASRNRSYAYRFKTPHKVVVFTGDTGELPGLARFAEGADILVCEIVSPGVLMTVTEANRYHMVAEHLSPTQVGQLARDAKVKMVVLSHLVSAQPEDLVEIRKWFSGKVVMGEDLQVFD